MPTIRWLAKRGESVSSGRSNWFGTRRPKRVSTRRPVSLRTSCAVPSNTARSCATCPATSSPSARRSSSLKARSTNCSPASAKRSTTPGRWCGKRAWREQTATRLQRAMTEPIVRFVRIGKTYDGVTRVVDELDLDIECGEFLTLLGPSGSGKTTTLMMLAGFETPTSGEILLDGKPLSRMPPYRRQIGMVFQNYALFPHMTVAENIGFPLSVRGVARDEMTRRVERALDMVQLGAFGSRRPSQLSGGQQQRIAVARALVFEPKLVLMDEPLGALDKQLREQLQLEIRRLHQRLGVTMVYVTHDQAEALTMSDRIAVFHRGKIQQLDRPAQLYEAPVNAFVARFIGENNRFDGSLQSVAGDRCSVRIADDACIEGSLAVPLQVGAR